MMRNANENSKQTKYGVRKINANANSRKGVAYS